ncbi:MAG: Mobile element protein, partial [Olavius algarvensis Gamma 1 endosymbiont]
IPPFLCAESEFDRTLLEILQEENLVQPILRNVC